MLKNGKNGGRSGCSPRKEDKGVASQEQNQRSVVMPWELYGRESY